MSSISHGSHDMQAWFPDTLSIQVDLLRTQHQKRSQSGWQPVKSQALHHIAHLYHEERRCSGHPKCLIGEYISVTIGKRFSKQSDLA